MNLFLFRHGEAENGVSPDSSRRLSDRGRLDVQSVARQFSSRGLCVDICLFSPYRRTRETAELFLPLITSSGVAEVCDWLVPEVRAAEVIKHLQQLQAENILLVSHNPLLSELGALLIDGHIESMQILEAGELLVIETDILGLGLGRASCQLKPQTHKQSQAYS